MPTTTLPHSHTNLPPVVFLSSPDLWKYRRRGKHPAVPDRLEWTYELVNAYRVFDDSRAKLIAPRSASEDELSRFHTPECIKAVKELSKIADEADLRGLSPVSRPFARTFGFGDGDNPIFPGMFEAAGIRAGGALQAADLILRGEARTVFHYGARRHACTVRSAGAPARFRKRSRFAVIVTLSAISRDTHRVFSRQFGRTASRSSGTDDRLLHL